MPEYIHGCLSEYLNLSKSRTKFTSARACCIRGLPYREFLAIWDWLWYDPNQIDELPEKLPTSSIPQGSAPCVDSARVLSLS